MKEIGHYVMPDSDTWSFKTNKIRRDGSFFGYGNDLVRGFDVYRFNGRPIGDVPPLTPPNLKPSAASADTSARWMGAPRSSAPPSSSPGSCVGASVVPRMPTAPLTDAAAGSPLGRGRFTGGTAPHHER